MTEDANVTGDIEVLKAVEEIRRLEARYARYADEKRWADLAGLFAGDGTADEAPEPRMDSRVQSLARAQLWTLTPERTIDEHATG